MTSDTANLDVMRHAKHYNRAMAKLVIDRLDLRSRNGELRRSVLDFGAGQGTFLQLIQGQLPTANVKWLCVEPEEKGRAAISEWTQSVYADLSAIADQSLDCVYSLNVFEHIDNDRAVCAELLTKLKPGGLALVLVPAHSRLWTAMDTYVGHRRRYSSYGLRHLLANHQAVIAAEGWFDRTGYWVTRLFQFLQKNKKGTGALTESQVKLFDRAYYFAEPLLKLVAWITGVGVGKNRWILVRKIGAATAETTKAKRSPAKA